MLRFLIAISVIIIAAQVTCAQPELELKPNNIEFKDVFNRLQNIYFINKGNQVLTIDTIYYRSDLYQVRFDKYWHYPLNINPQDTVMMDCLLSGYLSVTSTDTTDTMYVMSNHPDGVGKIKIKIDFFNENNKSAINGRVTDGINAVAGAKVSFLYEGSYITSSTVTDINGNYSAVLPIGRYSVAAAKDSFHTTFFGQKSSPFTAKLVTLQSGIIQNANIMLKEVTITGNKISGKIVDSLSSSPLRKAILVIRKGDHNPRKISSQSLDEENTYTVFANTDGSYNAEVASPDYYLVQSFSDYFLPAYYSSETHSSTLWQQADSIFINTQLINKNIYLPRDSSYGGGIVEGKIILNGAPPDSLSDILVFAQSSMNNYLYGYTFSKENGEFKITNLPYGDYKLFAQKIGYDNFYSRVVKITPQSFHVNNVDIYVTINSTGHGDFIPGSIQLYPNYPNPFNPSTTIDFFIPSETQASLSVVNILGEEVQLFFNSILQRGEYKYTFNGDRLSSGTYFVTLKTPGKMLVRKILLLK